MNPPQLPPSSLINMLHTGKRANKRKWPCCFWLVLMLLITQCMLNVHCSHNTIHLDQTGKYHGLVIGFSNTVQTIEPQYINTTIISIMNQLQKTSNILKHLIGVEIGDVTIILPDKWSIDLDDLTHAHYDVHHANEYRSLSDADIIFTNDEKSQIITMQYGDCGEGALPINFPMLYVSDEYSARLLAHQWIIYRYGVFNEFGLEDDYNYPVYYTPAHGPGVKVEARVNSCHQGNPEAVFKYSNNCNNVTDYNTGRPINPNCDVIPAMNSIQSSFMYAPIAVSGQSFQLCNYSTHDYQSPTKHNIMCDYQSMQDVIVKHLDFERFKPPFNNHINNISTSASSIRFEILQHKNNLNEPSTLMANGNSNPTESGPKANVLYVLPKHNSKFLEPTLDSIKKMDYFQHGAMFALYGQHQFNVFNVSGWQRSSLLSMIFPDNEPAPENINLSKIFAEIAQQFRYAPGGMCVLFFSGDCQLENTNIDYIEHIADMLNKLNIRLQVIIYDQKPTGNVLRFFDVLNSKLNTKSRVEYAFGDHVEHTHQQQHHSSSHSSSMMEHASTISYRTQLTSIINTILYDMLQELTDQTHMLIKRQTIRWPELSMVDFAIDPSIGQQHSQHGAAQLIIEMSTNGKGSDLAFGFNLTDSVDGYRNVIRFVTFESYEKNMVIRYNLTKSGMFRFQFQSTQPNTWIATSVRVLSKQSLFTSYKDGAVYGKCWIQANVGHPLRGYVHIRQGLNGPVYDADVTFVARSFNSKTNQHNQAEITFPLNDNGRGNPDITAHDGIYSAYLDSLFGANQRSNGEHGEYVSAYSITAKIVSDKIALKPGNFGNTVMFASKSRCCGSELKTNGDLILNHRFERIVHCGSFYYNHNVDDHSQPYSTASYAIRDLRIVNLNADNRTIQLEWSSPFTSVVSPMFDSKSPPIIIKAFHSYSQHSRLPADIKIGFDRIEHNEADVEVITNDADDVNSNANDVSGEHLSDADELSVLYDTILPAYGTQQNSATAHLPGHIKSQTRAPPLSPPTTPPTITNSLRQISIRILSPQEGYYMIAVKERNNQNESKPSNIVTVYLKSNVLVENTTALAIDNNRLTVGEYLDKHRSRPLPWILLICIICSLILFIIILITICFTIRRFRRSSSVSSHKSVDANSYDHKKHQPTLVVDDSGLHKSTSASTGGAGSGYYLTGNNHDANSLISHDKMIVANSTSASNHTSCSSVNTVDGAPVSGGHHNQQQQVHSYGNQESINMEQSAMQTSSPPSVSQHQSTLLKELNVATMLPNSWDAKELLDHWGRVQEAKLRQESPPPPIPPPSGGVAHHQRVQQSNSPSVLSYGGSSTLDYNHHHHNQTHPQHAHHQHMTHPTANSYLCQPAIVQGQQHYGHGDYHHQQQHAAPPPQSSSSSSAIYSPYSNASSIWQHHQKQQQQQQQLAQHVSTTNMPYSMIDGQHQPQQTMSNYDDNGLPEYSVVRKIMPNISQV